MSGAIYFLVNEAMPGLVKIGHTTNDVESRLRQLNSTGVPNEFRVVAVFHVSDSQGCEAAIHKKLQVYRANPKREFFTGAPGQLISEALEVIGRYLTAGSAARATPVEPPGYSPDKDDIYFMFFLLHDGYQHSRTYSANELAEHHSAYSAVELDLKLMTLEEHGYVRRVNKTSGGIGEWILTPTGLRFMIEGGHHDQQLLDESKEV